MSEASAAPSGASPFQNIQRSGAADPGPGTHLAMSMSITEAELYFAPGLDEEMRLEQLRGDDAVQPLDVELALRQVDAHGVVRVVASGELVPMTVTAAMVLARRIGATAYREAGDVVTLLRGRDYRRPAARPVHVLGRQAGEASTHLAMPMSVTEAELHFSLGLGDEMRLAQLRDDGAVQPLDVELARRQVDARGIVQVTANGELVPMTVAEALTLARWIGATAYREAGDVVTLLPYDDDRDDDSSGGDEDDAENPSNNDYDRDDGVDRDAIDDGDEARGA